MQYDAYTDVLYHMMHTMQDALCEQVRSAYVPLQIAYSSLMIVTKSADSGEEQMAYTEDNIVVKWASAVNGTCSHHLINDLE
jgi:hypothetical protein